MRKINYILLLILLSIMLINTKSYADEIANYIILGDIAPYQRLTKTIDPDTEELKTIPGYWIYRNAGVLAGADHFQEDHNDVTYKTKYQSKAIGMGMVVEVTQHAGADSDKWLLHELEENYRDDETERLGLLTDGAVMRKIDNNRVLWLGIGGGTFRWVRNNIVISISYTDLQGTKAEPIEVVKAYLAKFPSTITLTDADLKGNDHNVQWIKDEMERQLWLCDKWSMQLQLGKVTQAEMLQALVKHMTVFLNYRQKYLSQYVEKEKTADKEITALSTYLTANDGTSIKAKLTEYKTWWTANKSKSISL